MKFILRFSLLYGALAVAAGALFVFAPRTPDVHLWPHSSALTALDGFLGLAIHEALHFLAGFAVGLLTRRLDMALASGLAGWLIDLDHVYWYVGLDVPARASHNIMFLVASSAAIFAAARAGWLGNVELGKALGITLAVLPAHAAVEAVTPFTRVPFLGPWSATHYVLSPVHIPLLLAVAAALVLAAGLLDRRRAAAPRSLRKSRASMEERPGLRPELGERD